MSERDRLAWRCRRGMLELDLLLQDYLDQRYDQADSRDRQAFERLLGYPDQELLAYLMGQAVAEDKDIDRVVQSIRRPPAA